MYVHIDLLILIICIKCNNIKLILIYEHDMYILILYICISAYIYINAIVRLPYLRSGDNQGKETFLAPSADNQTRNYDTESSNRHPLQSTLR